ncbi:MAG: polynucleotide adenylyltransferase PcnB [bacterium]
MAFKSFLYNIFKKSRPAKFKKIPHDKHSITLKMLDSDAVKVINRLIQHGFEAYLVGGCVRDMLTGKPCKDFDVVTNALPGKIKKIFINCLLVGRRFRLAHIRFKKRKIIEVSTFRRGNIFFNEKDPLIKDDNTYGNVYEDVFRRDLTINALLLDTHDLSLHDYVGGFYDIENKIVRVIGDPQVRFREDPLRILRCIRFAGKLNFRIEQQTSEAIFKHRNEIWKPALPRILEELHRILRSGGAERSLRLLQEYGIFEQMMPELHAILTEPEENVKFMELLKILDKKISGNKIFSDSFLYALINCIFIKELLPDKKSGYRIFTHKALSSFFNRFQISKRNRHSALQILVALPRLANFGKAGVRPRSLIHQVYFHEAIKLFGMLSEVQIVEKSIYKSWQKLSFSFLKETKSIGYGGQKDLLEENSKVIKRRMLF